MRRPKAEAERPVAILCYDEKPGIQAIATTAPDLLPKPSKHPTVQRDHEDKRLGTVTFSAAVDLVTGVVHHAIMPSPSATAATSSLPSRSNSTPPTGLGRQRAR
jgi:hypothetical protein